MPFTLTGADLRALRTGLGVTQVDIARALGYTKSAICNWERRANHSIPRTQYQPVLDYLTRRREALERQAGQHAQLRTEIQTGQQIGQTGR